MFPFKYFIRLVLLGLLALPLTGQATRIDSTATEIPLTDYAKLGARALEEMAARNAENDRLHRSELNQYVLDLEAYALLNGVFSKDVSDTDKPKQISAAKFNSLNNALIKVNTENLADKDNIYLIIDSYVGTVNVRKLITGALTIEQLKAAEIGNAGKQTASSYNAYKALYDNIAASGSGVQAPPSPKGMQIIGMGFFQEVQSDPTNAATKEIEKPAYYLGIRNRLNAPDISSLVFNSEFSRQTASFDEEGYYNLLLSLIDRIKKGINNEIVDDLTGTGKTFYQNCLNNVYPGGSSLDKNKLREVSLLITKLINQNVLTNYLGVAVQSRSTSQALTNADLEKLKNRLLELEKISKNTASDIPTLTGLQNILDFFKLLSETSMCPQNDGILPKVLWDNSTADQVLAYSATDIALGAGFVDGAYIMLKDLLQLTVNSQQLIQCLNPVSPTFWLPDASGCTNIQSTAESAVNFLKEFIEKEDVRNNAGQIFGLTTTIVGSQIKEEFFKWSSEITCTNNSNQVISCDRCNRYTQGKLVFDVASMFIGVGEAKAVQAGTTKLTTFISNQLARLGKLLAKVTLATGNGLRFKAITNLVSNRTKTIALAIAVTVNSSAKAFIRIPPVSADDAVRIVCTASKKETSLIQPIKNALTNASSSEAVGKITDVVAELGNDAGQALKTFGNGDVEIFKKTISGVPADLNAEYLIVAQRRNNVLQVISALALGGALAGTTYNLTDDDATANCNVCAGRTAEIIAIYQTLCARAQQKMSVSNVESALNKLCALSNAKEIGEKLKNGEDFNSSTDRYDYLVDLLSDLIFTGSCNSVAYGTVTFKWIGNTTYIANLTIPMLDAWRIYKKAGRSCLRQSLDHLQMLTQVYQNQAITQTPFYFDFEDFKRVSEASGGQQSRTAETDAEVFASLNTIVNHQLTYPYIAARDNFGLKQNLTNAGFFTVAGANFVMRYINANVNVFRNFRLHFEDNVDLDEFGSRVTDLRIESILTGSSIFYEFKSYKDITKLEFVKQFTKDLILANTDNVGNSIKWVFDEKRMNPPPNGYTKNTFLKQELISKLVNSIDKLNSNSFMPEPVRIRVFGDRTVTEQLINTFMNTNFQSIFIIY